MITDVSKDGFYKLEKSYTVSMSEQDMKYTIKPSALLNYLQDAASKNIEGTPFGNVELNNIGIGWFLVRYRIEFDKYPVGVHDFIVKTENRGMLRQSAYRDFEAYKQNGERILRATTSWLMVDIANKSLVNIEQKFPQIRKFEKHEDDLTLRKLRPFSDSDLEKLFHVRYDDLDMNGHVNNTVYLAWAMEAVDYEFRNTHNIKAIDIYYKHEAKYGEDILSCIKIDKENLISEHVIKNAQNNEELCLMKIEYEKL